MTVGVRYLSCSASSLCNRIPLATERFNESTRGEPEPPSMYTEREHARRVFVRKPRPSLPSTTIVPTELGALSKQRAGTASIDEPVAAITSHPCTSRAAARSFGSCLLLSTSISSSAPAEALLAAELSGAEFFALQRSPAAPRKYALRATAPCA